MCIPFERLIKFETKMLVEVYLLSYKYLMIQSNSLIITQHFCIDIYIRIKWWKIDKMASWVKLESQKMMEKLAIPDSNLEV